MKTQIFIRVKCANGECIDKDIRSATEEERFEYYINSSHGMLADVIDKLLVEIE